MPLTAGTLIGPCEIVGWLGAGGTGGRGRRGERVREWSRGRAWGWGPTRIREIQTPSPWH